MPIKLSAYASAYLPVQHAFTMLFIYSHLIRENKGLCQTLPQSTRFRTPEQVCSKEGEVWYSAGVVTVCIEGEGIFPGWVQYF
jgi:hypothetical protein